MSGLSSRTLAVLAVGGVSLFGLAASPARADVFDLTSCHLGGGCGTATNFGTVTLTQDGANVDFQVVLASGDNFVETGAGGGSLFIFNDTLSGSTVTNISVPSGGGTAPSGGLSGLTNQPPFHADGTGSNWTASVFCTTASQCNGNSGVPISALDFTVTNATLAQLEMNGGNVADFVADILLGQPGGTGLTGPVDAEPLSSVPLPGAALLFGSVLFGGLGVSRLRKRRARGPVSVIA